MGLQRALHPLLSDVGSDVEVFEFGVAAVQVDDQRVLLDDAFLLLLLSLPCFVALLHLLDDAEGVLQVGGGHGGVARSFEVRCSVCSVDRRTKKFQTAIKMGKKKRSEFVRGAHISLTKVASGLGKMFPSCRPRELPGT